MTVEQPQSLEHRRATGQSGHASLPARRRGAATAAPSLRAARLISTLLLVMMATSSAGGLLIDGLYQDPTSVAERFRASDLITLAVATPLLAMALWRSRRGSPRAQLLWISMLAYGLYSYAFYVFGTSFNDFFLLHVALFTGSLYAFGLALVGSDIATMGRAFRDKTPARGVAAVLAVLAVSLGALWIVQALNFAATGELPGESQLVSPIDSIHLAYALDLAVLVPGYALAAILLWRRAAWGFVLGTALLVSGVLHQLNYMVGLVFQTEAGVAGASAFDVAEVPIAVAFLAAAAVMLAGVTDSQESRTA